MTESIKPNMPQFPGYELERQLGEGGMGEVWLARDLSLDRRVALKVLRQALLDDRTAQERFRREARTVARLSHPGIVKIFAVGEHEERGFFSMEYIDGMSLRDLLERDGFLPLDRSLDLLEQAAEAIDAAHREGVIHRDIKPSNILIDSLDRVTVSDFGLARIQEHPSLTEPNAVVGTPGYLAPEYFKGSRGSAHADIYAFGVCAYECLTGRKPIWDEEQNLVKPYEVLGHIPVSLSNMLFVESYRRAF